MYYLTFTIAGETCAVGIDNVESVLDYVPLNLIPGSPDYVVGLLNLRGEAVPVVDVRLVLRMAELASRQDASIVVLSTSQDREKRLVGALVDSVCEVIQLEDESISPIDEFAVTFDRSVIRGIGSRDGLFITILETERLFARLVASPAA